MEEGLIYWTRNRNRAGPLDLMSCLTLHLMFLDRNILVRGSVLGCTKEDHWVADSSFEEGFVPGRFVVADELDRFTPN